MPEATEAKQDKALESLKQTTTAQKIASFTMRGVVATITCFFAIDATGWFMWLLWIAFAWQLFSIGADYNKVLQSGDDRFTIMNPNEKR